MLARSLKLVVVGVLTTAAYGDETTPLGNIKYTTSSSQDTSAFTYSSWSTKIALTNISASSLWTGNGNDAWNAEIFTCLFHAGADLHPLVHNSSDPTVDSVTLDQETTIDWICCGECSQYTPLGNIQYTTGNADKTYEFTYANWSSKVALVDVSASTVWTGQGDEGWNSETFTCLFQTGGIALHTLKHDSSDPTVDLVELNQVAAIDWICCGDCSQYNGTDAASPASATVTAGTALTSVLATAVINGGVFANNPALDPMSIALAAAAASADHGSKPPKPTNAAVKLTSGTSLALGGVAVLFGLMG